MLTVIPPAPTLERMFLAMEKVKERLHRAVAVFESAGIPYAVVGGFAVARWVASIDESRQRNTRDIDILVRRDDLDRIKAAMSAAGFIYANVSNIDLFIDGEKGKPSEGVHLIFESEKIKPEYFTTSATLNETVNAEQFRVVSLEALIRMKLESNRPKDQAHIVDLLNVGLIDESWPEKYPSPLRERLESLVNDPNNRQPF